MHGAELSKVTARRQRKNETLHRALAS
jgi:hypothetical protein